jgi:hypothetical protein
MVVKELVLLALQKHKVKLDNQLNKVFDCYRWSRWFLGGQGGNGGVIGRWYSWSNGNQMAVLEVKEDRYSKSGIEIAVSGKLMGA